MTISPESDESETGLWESETLTSEPKKLSSLSTEVPPDLRQIYPQLIASLSLKLFLKILDAVLNYYFSYFLIDRRFRYFL